jgi:hypothetical protein
MRRSILSAAAPACLLIGLTPVAATADVAPPGSATATAARVSDLVEVSRSAATADQSKSDAQAAVISLQGKPALGTGGSQSGEGENNGALLDTGPGQAPQVRVAPWKAKASGSKGAKRSSSAEAALARVDVPAQTNPGNEFAPVATENIRIGVLTSEANAEHTPEKSTGTSTSNAADIAVGNTLRLVLLHSAVESGAKGNSYLVGLNGTKIGTQEQLNEVCSLDVSGVAALSCLTASGGTANGITTGAAEVLGVSTALGLNPASAFATTGTAATGTLPPSILESVAAAVPAAEAPRAAEVVTSTATETALPRTGVAVASLAVSAVAGLLMGLILRLLGRRRLAA